MAVTDTDELQLFYSGRGGRLIINGWRGSGVRKA
jgi:hypothetical protein